MFMTGVLCTVYGARVYLTLLKHQLIRDKTFALIRWCGNEVYKVGKVERRYFQENPERHAVATFRWPRKSFYGPKIIYINIAKCSFTVFDNMIFDSG